MRGASESRSKLIHTRLVLWSSLSSFLLFPAQRRKERSALAIAAGPIWTGRPLALGCLTVWVREAGPSGRISAGPGLARAPAAAFPWPVVAFFVATVFDAPPASGTRRAPRGPVRGGRA